jgi:hypothetical protein
MDDVKGPDETTPEDVGEYCRAVEHHLCQRNQGHLVRVVGPAFDVVCGWVAVGVPIRVALLGVDRTVDRQARKGPRRRPVRVEHCDADVRDAFDEWRRAVGVPRADASDEEDGGASRRGSLTAHLDRCQARLAAAAAREDDAGPRVRQAAGDAAVAVGELARSAKRARGTVRDEIGGRLRDLDATLLEAARADASAEFLTELARQADGELASYRGRMSDEAFGRARSALVDRLLREWYQLPVVGLEG